MAKNYILASGRLPVSDSLLVDFKNLFSNVYKLFKDYGGVFTAGPGNLSYCGRLRITILP